MKKYKCGIMVGRFSPIHIGHEHLINIGLSKCDKMLIIISCNKTRDTENPYTYNYRKLLLEKIYSKDILEGRLYITKISNQSNIDTSYGKKILKIAKENLGMNPELIVYGSDKNVLKCFDIQDLANINLLKVDRNKIKTSASNIREYLILKDYEQVKLNINPKIFNEIEELRSKVLDIKPKKELLF